MGANSKLVRQAYAAFGTGDIPGLLGLLDADVEWTSPATLPHGGEFSGPAEVGKFFEAIGANWDSLELDIESVNEVGPTSVLGVAHADGTRKGGKSQSYGAVHIFDVSDGKITRFREFVDA
jgi:ketosteroid isomerase-like protein